MDLPELLNYKVDIYVSVKERYNIDKLKSLILDRAGIADLSKKIDNVIIQERHAILLKKIYEIIR